MTMRDRLDAPLRALALSASVWIAAAGGCAEPRPPDMEPRPRAAQERPAPEAEPATPVTPIASEPTSGPPVPATPETVAPAEAPASAVAPVAASAPRPQPAAERTDSLRPTGDGDAVLRPAARIADERIAEGSGLAFAGGWWWTHNDSGDGPFLFRSRTPWFEDAERIRVEGATALDWEELAVLDGDLLVCDIGDNLRARPQVFLFRVRPTPEGVEKVATYRVAYPDGSHDAEGVWVWEGHVHIVLKNRGEDAHWVYRFGELTEDGVNTPERIGSVTLPLGEQVTAADSSADGWVAMLTYSQLSFWRADAVEGEPVRTFGLHARQCEALAFTDTGVVFTNEQRDAFHVDRPLECGLDPWLPPSDGARVPTPGAPFADFPARNLRPGEHVRIGRVGDRLVLDMRFEREADLIPSEGRLGTSVLLAFGTEPRRRVTPDEPQLAIALAPEPKAIALNMGAGRSNVDADSVKVTGAVGDADVTLHVEIPVATLFLDGLPRRFRMALVGNGLRNGDDEPLFGALDGFTLQRPFAWGRVVVDGSR